MVQRKMGLAAAKLSRKHPGLPGSGRAAVVCALFVEQAYRRRGLARALLRYIREDAARMGITTLYLVTEHTDFYEKCGWQHCAMCKDDDGLPLRVYKAETRA